MSKWSEFIKGNFAGPVIQINNATELHTLQSLAESNRLDGYDYFLKQGYKEILHLLEINYDRLHRNQNKLNGFYRDTKNGRSFLVEYSSRKGGFTYGCLYDYDEVRRDAEEWEIIPMQEIINELKIELKIIGRLKMTNEQKKQTDSMRNELISTIEAQEVFSPLSSKEAGYLCRALVRKGYTDFRAGDYIKLYHELRSEDYNWKYVIKNY